MSLEQVKEFHEAFGHPVSKSLRHIDRDRFELRYRLIEEELVETLRDYISGDLVKVADGLSDLGVVINGSLLEFGYVPHSNYNTEEYFHIKKGTVPHLDSPHFIVLLASFVFGVLEDMYVEYEAGNTKLVGRLLWDIKRDVSRQAAHLGIPLEEIDEAVHKANMSKLGADGKPIYRESDNKILKGPNFRPPEEDIEKILRDHGADL